MADKDDPKGSLSVEFTARLPAPGDSIYKWLEHPLREQAVHAFSAECTQAEGRRLVEKIRASNTGLEVKARWTGDLGL